MNARIASVALVLVAATTTAAIADPEAEAKSHIDRATGLYNEGKTAEALQELELAYALAPSPQLLYAMAQAHVVLDQCDDAVPKYEQFLSSGPAPKQAALAQQAIEHCKKVEAKPVEQPAPVQTPEPAPPPQPAVDKPATAAWYANPIAIARVGGGLVSGIASIVLYRSASSDLDASRTAADYTTHHRLVEDGRSARTYAVVAGVGGVVLVGAGVAYFALEARSSRSTVGAVPAQGGGIVTWSGRF